MAQATTNTRTLIKDQVANMLVRPLEAASVFLAAGPQIIDSAAPVRVPRLDSSGDVHWVGENEQIPDTYEMKMSEIALMPTERKSLKTISRVSNELIRMADQNVSSILQTRIVEDVRNKLDDALLVGDGANNSITGLFNQAGVQTGTLDLAQPDTLLDAMALATAAEVTPDRWFINAGDFYTLRKVKDGNGRYIMTEDIQAGAASYSLFGVPVTVSNKVPKGKSALVSMKELVVVRDTDPQITILDERYAEYDQTGIRVTSRFDLGILRPAGVIILSAAAA